MNLQFHYGATTPYILHQAKGLQIGLMNPPCTKKQESWKLPPGEYFQRGNFHCLKSDSYILGAASVEVCPQTLSDTTESLYDQLLKDNLGFSLYRIWHFIPQINQIPEGHIENYQAFCKGRALAFEAHAQEALQAKMPAATGVGTPGNHLTLIYLAGKPPSTHIENPRQTPAYYYPGRYGPKPPFFARATTAVFNHKPTLFISGTASILASESIGNTIESQLATTIENLQAIASNAPDKYEDFRKVRVYLRHADDFAYVKSQLEINYLSTADEVDYIIADICRKELLVEIEVTVGIL